jgi:hypothetical protein
MPGEFIPEITPKMIEAGVHAAREHALGAPLADLVAAVYLAMALESASASPIRPSK